MARRRSAKNIKKSEVKKNFISTASELQKELEETRIDMPFGGTWTFEIDMKPILKKCMTTLGAPGAINENILQDSMTASERQNPILIEKTKSRLQRIARGAGMSESDAMHALNAYIYSKTGRTTKAFFDTENILHKNLGINLSNIVTLAQSKVFHEHIRLNKLRFATSTQMKKYLKDNPRIWNSLADRAKEEAKTAILRALIKKGLIKND